MLEALPAKRDKFDRLRIEARYDLFEDGAPVGDLLYDPGRERAEIMLKGAVYHAASPRPREGERLYQVAIRLARGRSKPAPNPFELFDGRGGVVASAEGKGFRRAIVLGDQTYSLKRRSLFSRRFDLYRGAISSPLGSVGQRSLFSRSLVADLPATLPTILPAFLMALLLDMTFAYSEDLASQSG